MAFSHYYVIDIKTGNSVWTATKELAIGLVNTYHKLGREADYIEIEEDFEGIPF